MNNQNNQIEKAKEYIKNADAILITAGAGMGVDSGLPDFRGNEGFWRAYPVIRKLGHSFVDMANPQWFDSNPHLAWAFYGHRLNLYRATVPHDGFRILKELVDSKKDYFIFTSNVDGQFQKAGFDRDKIYECHGSIHHFQCTYCAKEIYSAKNEEVAVDMVKFEALNLPKCPECDRIARPNILMFDDWGWSGERSAVQSARLDDFKANVYENSYKLAIIEIGAGEHIPTVRYESEYSAIELDGFVVRINPRDYQIDDAIGVGIALGGLEGLESLL
ncbi:NAD-dependent deacetylase [Sulfurovum sp. bin170]|uniref:SIR2 family NAD-dependent protein deacylase n=1 Tax=Sulfurovum sp. bin170 TaxID=2695268 RepID=UPI0013DFEA14|nr:Sir2 family NAD-dependent protein deacetylase [Sulfurovum sp. bin170]NEW60994.1 NAD-dependent deacetylase [Sulfurovum sp. bin170]